jgi:O-antigen ligase
VTAHIPLTPERINVLRRIIEAVLIFVCAGIILTYFSIVPLSALTAHLPKSPDIAGPWSNYAYLAGFGGMGWGTIGYNHAYVAAQVIMLVSLKIHLILNQKLFFDNMLLFVSIIACFLSESRAGLATILIFAMICWFQKPIYAVIAAVVAVVIGTTAIAFASKLRDLTSVEGSTIEHQATLLEANNAENLNGRAEIWIDRLALLDKEPMLWFLGSGFGSAVDSGANAHMLYLHIILETGLFGLLIFVLLFSRILYYLYIYELRVKPIFWVTVAFLVSSLTQETFYPVPAFGHFIGLYLCSLAIALQSCGYKKESQQFALN